MNAFLILSDELRPGFSASLGLSSVEEWAKLPKGGIAFPDFFASIYSVVKGTPRQCREQSLMDFIPGYRLIELSELVDETRAFRRIYADSSATFPFLANYSSDYVCWEKGRVVSCVHDDPARHVLHNDVASFWATLCAFYEEGVYSLVDGFLDSDLDLESNVATRLNPGVRYWEES